MLPSSLPLRRSSTSGDAIDQFDKEQGKNLEQLEDLRPWRSKDLRPWRSKDLVLRKPETPPHIRRARGAELRKAERMSRLQSIDVRAQRDLAAARSRRALRESMRESAEASRQLDEKREDERRRRAEQLRSEAILRQRVYAMNAFLKAVERARYRDAIRAAASGSAV